MKAQLFVLGLFFNFKLLTVSFLYPSFLWALVAVIIPIIIHLFNFRRYKTIYFSNLNYLRNIKKETKSKSQLKHLFILFARIFTIIFLVLAFAQPYKPAQNKESNVNNAAVAIYIDNSFSMEAQAEEGTLFNLSQNSAIQILNSFPQNSRFYIITNDFENSHQHSFTREKVFDILTKLEISPKVKPLSDILMRADDIMAEDLAKNEKASRFLFVLSDFQKSSANFADLATNLKIETYFLPLKSAQANNLYIDSVYFDSPGRKINQAENINIKLVNKSNEIYQNIPVKLSINGMQKALSTFSVSAHSENIVSLSYTNPETEIVNGKIEITDYPIIFDNTFFFSYVISQKIEILEIFEDAPNKFISALYSENDNLNLKNVGIQQVSISDFKNYHLIILSQVKQLSSGIANALKEFVSAGGTLLISPDFTSTFDSYNSFLTEINQPKLLKIDTVNSELRTINLESELYKTSLKSYKNDVKLPVIEKYFRLSEANKSYSLITAKNNSVILTESYFGKGKSYLFAIPFAKEAGNFVNHKIFVPTLFNIALYSQNTSEIYYTLGKNNLVEIPVAMAEDFQMMHVQNLDKTYDFIPEVIKNSESNALRINFHDNIKLADNYVLTENDKLLGAASFNYDRTESIMEFYSEDEIISLVEKLSNERMNVFKANDKFIEDSLSQFSKGSQFWKYFLLLALLTLAAEILLIRIKKPQNNL